MMVGASSGPQVIDPSLVPCIASRLDYGHPFVEAGCVGAWLLGESQRSVDYSRYHNDAIFQGTSITTQPFPVGSIHGNGMNTGVGAVAVAPYIPAYDLKTCTIAAWIQRSVLAPGSAESTICGKLPSAASGTSFPYRLSITSLGASSVSASDAGILTTSVSPSLTAVGSAFWHFLCGTIGPANMTLYLDGLQLGQTSSSAIEADPISNSAGFCIGANADASQPFLGCIESVFLFSFEMTPLQVLSLFRFPYQMFAADPIRQYRRSLKLTSAKKLRRTLYDRAGSRGAA